jgi:hypothetical protein
VTILAAIAREERKLEKQLGQLQHQLDGVKTAAKALGKPTNRELAGVKKCVLSTAGRAKIAAAARRRWARVSKQAKQVRSAAAPLQLRLKIHLSRNRGRLNWSMQHHLIRLLPTNW